MTSRDMLAIQCLFVLVLRCWLLLLLLLRRSCDVGLSAQSLRTDKVTQPVGLLREEQKK